VTGGGTGGHVTPIRHVVASLKDLDPKADITYIGQAGDRFADMITDTDASEKVGIVAGKFRRYQRPLWQTIIDIPTHLLNLRDAVYVGIGYIQALMFLRRFRPNAVFVKGGYVSVPVGLAAATLRLPIITHDSDMTPGLANKTVGKWARYNAVASGSGIYPYSPEKMKIVGVPVSSKFYQKIDDARKLKARKVIGAGDSQVIFVLGGSLGAKAINDGMIAITNDLMESSIEVFHVTGVGNLAAVSKKIGVMDTQGSYHLLEFISDPDLLIEYYIAADLIVSRGGATNTAEIAALGKPAVIIPGQQLSDQQANARELEKADAAIILQDDEIAETPERLYEAIDLALNDEELGRGLGRNISKLASKNASVAIAELLFEVANG